MERNKSKDLVQVHPRLALDSLYTSERATTRSQLVKSPTKISQSSLFVDSLAPEMESRKKETIDEKQVALKAFSPSQTFINKSKQRARDQLPDKKEKEPWLPKLLGGILGTLLALAFLLPAFIFLIVLLDGDVDDTPAFDVGRKDSFFVRAFKRSFNGVLKVGMTVLFWLFTILIILAILVFLYTQFGVVGLILGIVLIIIAVLLLAYLLNSFFEFLFPGITD